MGGVGGDLNRKGDKNTPEKWDGTATGAPHLATKDKRGGKDTGHLFDLQDDYLKSSFTRKRPIKMNHM